jgi:drug/metabolite transporter (DMT)-like permease
LSKPAAAYVALFAGVVGISFTAIFTKLAGMPAPVAAFYRMGIASLVMTLLVLSRRPSLSPGAARWGLAGGLWFAANLLLLNAALGRTSAATATLLDNTAPIWVGLGAMVFFGERLGPRYWIGLSLALAGASVVTGAFLGQGSRLESGALLALVGAIFYAGYLLNTQRARRELDAVTYLWLVACTAAGVIFMVCLTLRLPLTGYPLRSYAAMLGVGLVSQTAGWLLINFALGVVPASAAVVVLLAQPVITGLLAIPILGERLTWPQVAGGALALTGIYLCLRRPGAEAPAQAQLEARA